MEDPVARLVNIMSRLRGPDGCPWDREQTLDSLKTYLLEECHEVRQALEEDDPISLKEELGDLLFQIVFQSRVSEEKGWFTLDQVATTVGDKLVRRHPHVFGKKQLSTSQEVVRQWEELKDEERSRRGKLSRLEGIPAGLPALQRALRLSQKTARVGFDWDRTEQVFEKVREEIGEWETSTHDGDQEAMARELGDLLFGLVNVARRLGIEPESALQATNDRFRRRFSRIERELVKEGKKPEEVLQGRLEELWKQAKRAEGAD